MVCGPCQLGKQTKAKHPGTQTSATSRPLELLHLDLMGLTRTESLGGKRYIMVVVDNFTRYTWVILLRSKLDSPKHFKALCTRLQNEKSLKIDRIRSDHGKEFENSYMESFCRRSDISQEFSAPITPQQNDVVEERKGLFRRWLEPCCTVRIWLETCGEKPLTLHVIWLIGCTLDLVPRRLHMNYGNEESQM